MWESLTVMSMLRSVPLSIKLDPVDLRDSMKSGVPAGRTLHANFMQSVGMGDLVCAVWIFHKVKCRSFVRA